MISGAEKVEDEALVHEKVHQVFKGRHGRRRRQGHQQESGEAGRETRWKGARAGLVLVDDCIATATARRVSRMSVTAVASASVAIADVVGRRAAGLGYTVSSARIDASGNRLLGGRARIGEEVELLVGEELAEHAQIYLHQTIVSTNGGKRLVRSRLVHHVGRCLLGNLAGLLLSAASNGDWVSRAVVTTRVNAVVRTIAVGVTISLTTIA